MNGVYVYDGGRDRRPRWTVLLKYRPLGGGKYRAWLVDNTHRSRHDAHTTSGRSPGGHNGLTVPVDSLPGNVRLVVQSLVKEDNRWCALSEDQKIAEIMHKRALELKRCSRTYPKYEPGMTTREYVRRYRMENLQVAAPFLNTDLVQPRSTT